MSIATAAHPTTASVARSIFWWFQEHKKIRWALLFVVVCTACYLFNTGVVWADTEAESNASTFALPLAGVTDTHGVPISRYTELPMDPGNGPAYVLRSARFFIASMFWVPYSLFVMLVIALVDWILAFEWLEWLSAPFVTLSEGVSGVLEGWMLIPLGLSVSALVIGIGYVRGRTGAATVEVVMIVLVFGFLASSYANPMNWLSGDGSDAAGDSGLIQQAADAGSEAGVLTVNEEADPSDSSVAGSVIDITLRNPMLSMAFGSTLEGDCAARWNDNAADPSNDTEEIREEVIGCSDEVADANQTDGFGWLGHYILAWPAMIGIMALIGVFLAFLIFQVVQVFIGAIIAVIRGFMAVFPGNSRQAWLNSIFQILISIVLIGVYIFALTVYMWVVNAIVEVIPAGVTQIGTILLGIVVLIMAITFWKMKKAGKSIGERMSKALGRTGLAKDSAERKPSRFGSTTGNLAKSAAKQGLRMHTNGRMMRAATTATRAATTAAAVGTGGVGGVAAKVGTGMAAKAATTRAMTAASRGASAAGAAASPGAAQMGPGSKPLAGLPAAKSSAGLPAGRSAAQLPAGSPQPVGEISAPAGSENAPSSPLPPQGVAPSERVSSVTPPAGPQPVGGIPAPAGSENAPSSPLPPRGAVPTAQNSSSPQSGMNSGAGVPAPQPAGNMGSRRVSHIPAGNYGGTWVHKNGQTHRPVTVTPEGAPVRNVPSEEKINRGFQNGDSWVISSGVKPSGLRTAGAQHPSPQRPASPAQSPSATQTSAPTQSRQAPRPMQTRTEETPTRASRRAKPEVPAPIPKQAEGPQNRPTPRSMQPRGSEARRPKGGTE